MHVSKVTSKGQITIPKEFRERFSIEEGEEIIFEEKDGIIIIKKKPKKSILDKWIGYLKNKKGKSSDELVEELRGSG